LEKSKVGSPVQCTCRRQSTIKLELSVLPESSSLTVDAVSDIDYPANDH